VGGGWGIDGNVTLADSHLDFGACPAMQTATSGDPCDMLGASKTTANGGIYFENDKFNARVSYAWRSGLPGSARPRHPAVPGCNRYVVGFVQLQHQQEHHLDDQWSEPEQPDPEELHLQQGSTGTLLCQRRAVLRRPAREILIGFIV
jgi:hypothetical protein